MPIPEVLLVCLVVLDALACLRPGARSVAARPGLAAVVCALAWHCVDGGPHWQMIPVYLAALVLLAAVLSAGRAARWLAVGAIALVPVALAASWALPIFRLPAPDGPYQVGTRVFTLTDTARQEDAAYGGGPRQVVVQAWYPAACAGHPRAPYRRWKETTRLSSYQRFVWTHACEDAPVAGGGPYPVLLFEPAWNGRRTQSTYLTEELASQGYVVFAIDHPYNSGPVELGGGRVAELPPNPLEHLAALGFDGFYQLVNREVEKEAADSVFVLDTVTAWNADAASPFYRRLNLGEIGAVGHSLGGSVAAETAVKDPRVRAVFSMSGPLLATARRQGVAVPFFELTEPVPLLNPQQLAALNPDLRVDAETDLADFPRLFADLEAHGGWYAVLSGADHASFADKPLFSPVERLGGEPRATAVRRFGIIRAYAVAFFNRTLRGEPAPLLDRQPPPYPEIAVRHYAGRQAP